MKNIFSGALVLVFSVFLLGCQPKSNSHTINIGTMAGPESSIMEAAAQVAQEKYGLTVNITQFSDYTMPNRALHDGDIDANMFQTIPYLNADMTANDYDFVVIGKTFIYPMAIYSNKIKNINQTPKGAIVTIPNDPSNQARALILLQKAGLITLKPGVDVMATPNDIASNPKQLKIQPLDAATLSRTLPDVTMAVINTNYAILARLYPTKNSIFMEGTDSPYVNIVVVRNGEQNEAKFKELMMALHSQPVLDAANKLFQGQAIPGWN